MITIQTKKSNWKLEFSQRNIITGFKQGRVKQILSTDCFLFRKENGVWVEVSEGIARLNEVDTPSIKLGMIASLFEAVEKSGMGYKEKRSFWVTFQTKLEQELWNE